MCCSRQLSLSISTSTRIPGLEAQMGVVVEGEREREPASVSIERGKEKRGEQSFETRGHGALTAQAIRSSRESHGIWLVRQPFAPQLVVLIA